MELNLRTSAVNALKRTHQRVCALSAEAPDVFQLEQLKKSLAAHFERFVSNHNHLVGVAQKEELRRHDELWEEVEVLHNDTCATLNRLIAAAAPAAAPKAERCAGGAVELGVHELKLDPLAIPPFDGNLQNWLAFKDAFETLVHNTSYPEAFKLGKLRQAIDATDVPLLGGVYSGGYQAVWQSLKDRFDNRRQLAEIHVSRFLNLQPTTEESTKSLLAIVDTVHESLRALRVRNIAVSEWDALAVPIIVAKLPAVTKRDWWMQCSSNEIPLLKDLLQFLERRAHNLTSGLTTWSAESMTRPSQRGAQRALRSHVSAIDDGKCAHCHGAHRTTKCAALLGMSVEQRVKAYLYDAGWHAKGVICITEPRRASAITLANRVALEMGEAVGSIVGLAVSFLENCSKDTSIKYITEDILLREILSDPLLMRYSVVIIDEAHERTLFTDIVIGLLKKMVKKRKTLKIIIVSATIDADNFASFFNYKIESANQAVILSVDNKIHPVDIFYLSKPCANYLLETVETIMKIHKQEPLGDILAFLTGQDEVLKALNLLQEYTANEDHKSLQAVPMYGTLSSKYQLKVFFTAEKGMRKVILATNIAETSITIPGVMYVVDCGFTKINWFSPDHETDNFVVVPISKANAIQRAGRAGRIRSGKVFRIYTENDFTTLPDRLPPEIHRSELSTTILSLKALGVNNILRFNFLSVPATKNFLTALETLYILEAIDEKANLTKPLGYFMAELSISPMQSRMLYMSGQQGCSQEILTIIAMLQVESVFSKPIPAQDQLKCHLAKRNFEATEGDLITLLNVFNAFVENDQSKNFCKSWYLVYRNLKYAYELREYLTLLACRRFEIPLISCEGNVEAICKCITAGFFLNAAYLHHSGVYRRIRGGPKLLIHPVSSLYTLSQPQYVLYTDLMKTTELFMNNVTAIKEDWLSEMAPHFYHKSYIK